MKTTHLAAQVSNLPCRRFPIGSATNASRTPRASSPRALLAFSLVEIMVTVGLLSFIILGLLAMFHQTQRAFRSSITQTDVLEAGRAVTGTILAPEIEQISPSSTPNAVNFYADLDFYMQPLLQTLPGSTPATLRRTNFIQRIFYLTEMNDQWTGIGYLVAPITPGGNIGTLYRFTTNAVRYDLRAPMVYFNQAANMVSTRARQGYPLTNLPPGIDRVMEGVVHFRMRALAPNGFPIMFTNGTYYAEDAYSGRIKPVRYTFAGADPAYDRVQSNIIFSSNAVPAFVELELGILEPQLLPRLRSLPAQAQQNFLQSQAARVHLFRQTIPVRNVDYQAYQ